MTINHIIWIALIMVIPVEDQEFLRGGAAKPPGGPPTYDFAKISQKMHEI